MTNHRLTPLKSTHFRCSTEYSQMSQAQQNQLLNRVASFKNQFQNIVDRGTTIGFRYYTENPKLNRSLYVQKYSTENRSKSPSKTMKTVTTAFINPETNCKQSKPLKLSPFMKEMKTHSIRQRQCRNEINAMNKEKKQLTLRIQELHQKIASQNRQRYNAAKAGRRSMIYIQKTRDQSDKHTHQLHRTGKLIEILESECKQLNNEIETCYEKSQEIINTKHQEEEAINQLNNRVRYLKITTNRQNSELTYLKNNLNKHLKYLDKWAVSIQLINDERHKTLFEFEKNQINSLEFSQQSHRATRKMPHILVQDYHPMKAMQLEAVWNPVQNKLIEPLWDKCITYANCQQNIIDKSVMRKMQGDSQCLGRALYEHFPFHAANLENLNYMNIESLARRLPKTVSAEQLRVVCVNQQQAVISGLTCANLYADMAQISPQLDFSFIPIKHLQERIREIESKMQAQQDSDIQAESVEHLSIGKGQNMSAEDTGFDCELRNIMDQEQEYRNRGAWLHETALFDLI